MNTFPTNEEFSKNGITSNSEILKWRDLPKSEIFKINSVETVTTKYGESKILDIENRKGDISRVWCNQRLSKELDDICDHHWNECAYYFKSLGLRSSKQAPNRSYYTYELMSQDLDTVH